MTRNTPHAHKAFRMLVRPVIVAVLLLIGSGCARYHDVEAFNLEPHSVVAGTPYQVAPPDVLRVASIEAPELNLGRVMVGPDGTIDLPLIGVCKVAGKTPDQIAELIEQRAMKYYKAVDVAVQVTQYASKHIYVFGEVRSPGAYPYTGSDTMLDILARAQPTRLADTNRIQVMRPAGDGKTASRLTIRLSRWMKRGETERNGLMAESDILYIPPHGLARAGLMLQNLLRPVQPAAQTVRGTTNIDRDIDTVGQR